MELLDNMLADVDSPTHGKVLVNPYPLQMHRNHSVPWIKTEQSRQRGTLSLTSSLVRFSTVFWCEVA